MFRKIWTDPVWSKVISVAIIGLATYAYAFVKSKTENISVGEVYENFLQLKVKVVYVIVGVILFQIFNRLTKKKSTSYYSSKQRKLREFNKTTDVDTGIMFRWAVYFDFDKPFISDLEAFCTKHEGSPIRFVGNSCPINNCENHRHSIDFHFVKNHIESALIDNWDKLNQR